MKSRIESRICGGSAQKMPFVVEHRFRQGRLEKISGSTSGVQLEMSQIESIRSMATIATAERPRDGSTGPRSLLGRSGIEFSASLCIGCDCQIMTYACSCRSARRWLDIERSQACAFVDA